MQDDFQTREWADHHAAFSAGVDKLIRSVATAFASLNRQQFDAPWKRETTTPLGRRPDRPGVRCG